MAAFGADQQHETQRRDHPIGHRVFGQEAEPGRGPDGEPPAPAALRPHPDERVERRRPAQHQRRVGRHDEGRDRYSRQARIGERRPQPDAAIVKPRADRIKEDGGPGMQQRRRQPDRKLAVAKEGGRQRDQPRDQRRLRVIAEGQVLRPEPVLRLVGVKIGRLQPQPHEPECRDRRDPGEHRRSRGACDGQPQRPGLGDRQGSPDRHRLPAAVVCARPIATRCRKDPTPEGLLPS